jgi:cysteinyl-tRNA synthetase
MDWARAYRAALDLFGLRFEDAVAEAPADVQALAAERWQAKQTRDFARADALRAEVTAKGWMIRDAKDGYTVEKT